jgi:hypothetical protein
MSRFLSWLALGVGAAFLVVASVSFSLGAITSLAFAVGIGALIVSAGIAYSDRGRVASVYTAALVALISAWTIVASRVFSQPTVQHLALASSLAIASLTVVGLTEHEISLEHAAGSVERPASEGEGRLAAAA